MSKNRSVKLSLIGMGLLTALMLSLTLSQLGQVAYADKGGQANYQGQIDALLAQVNAQQAQINTLTTQLNAESAKLADVSADPLTGDLFVTGVNLHLRSGSGATAGAVNGAGNLIIGYNEGATGTGSHNLVVGNYHSYLSYGGIVVGQSNSILAPYACVSGGAHGSASAPSSSVNGGFGNTAAGAWSTVSGGSSHFAFDHYSWMAGSLIEYN